MKYVTILATATFVLAMHSLAIADQPNKIKNITYSSWSTTYKAPNGRNVKAQLAFEGENGFYKKQENISVRKQKNLNGVMKLNTGEVGGIDAGLEKSQK